MIKVSKTNYSIITYSPKIEGKNLAINERKIISNPSTEFL